MKRKKRLLTSRDKRRIASKMAQPGRAENLDQMKQFQEFLTRQKESIADKPSLFQQKWEAKREKFLNVPTTLEKPDGQIRATGLHLVDYRVMYSGKVLSAILWSMLEWHLLPHDLILTRIAEHELSDQFMDALIDETYRDFANCYNSVKDQFPEELMRRLYSLASETLEDLIAKSVREHSSSLSRPNANAPDEIADFLIERGLDLHKVRLGKPSAGRPAEILSKDALEYYSLVSSLIRQAKSEFRKDEQWRDKLSSQEQFAVLIEHAELLDELPNVEPAALARKYLQVHFGLPNLDDKSLETRIRRSRQYSQ